MEVDKSAKLQNVQRMCGTELPQIMFGSWAERKCFEIAIMYYSPWIAGIIGIIILIKSRSHYYGRRNPKFRR